MTENCLLFQKIPKPLQSTSIVAYVQERDHSSIERTSGIRRFSERKIDTIKLIECLKKSGLEIKDIRQFMQWIQQGKDTYKQRKQLFATQQRKVESVDQPLEITSLLIILDKRILLMCEMTNGIAQEETKRIPIGISA